MTQRLAEIVREAFPDNYRIRNALRVLFQAGYKPEQDHDTDFLEALNDKDAIFRTRLLAFWGRVERFVNRRPIEEQGNLDDEGFVDKDGAFSYIINFHSSYEYPYPSRLGQFQKRINKEDWKLANPYLYDRYQAIKPSSLAALWTIEHEIKLDDDEREHLLHCISRWPNVYKQHKSWDSIAHKVKNWKEKNVKEFYIERRARYDKAYQDGQLIANQSSLHNIDHELRDWSDRLMVTHDDEMKKGGHMKFYS